MASVFTRKIDRDEGFANALGMKTGLLAGWFIVGVLAFECAALEPANPNSTQRVKEILNFFVSLEQRENKRLVSGQFVNFGRGANLELMRAVHERTRHWPAVIGVDYADFPTGGITTDAPNKAATDYWNAGGWVHISAHMYNPARTNGGGLRDRGVNLDSLLDTNSPVHTRWMTQLDEIAQGLNELKQAGVVVLWRPFHEMNGSWFWWGGHEPDDFIRVWRHMFDYFTGPKQLNNLLWVYGPNHGERTAAYYPGDKYVDIIGLDAYTDHIDTAHIRGYSEIAEIRKPFGFTEFGPHGPERPPGDYDYLRFLRGIQEHFPRTVFFMSWNARWSLASNTNTAEFLSHPWIVNRPDLPRPQ